MKTFVKLTGLTDATAVALVPDGGAAGFLVNVPGAAASLPIDTVAELVESVPKEAEAWAIVENPSTELIHQLFDEAGVDRVQVYGPIPPELEFLEIHHIVPSLPIGAPGAGAALPTVPPAEDYSRLHLDLAGTPLSHASSKPLDWDACRQIVENQPGRKVVVAGGLDASNVAGVFRSVQPWGLDVFDGIQTTGRGVDPAKVQAFLAAVSAAESPAA